MTHTTDTANEPVDHQDDGEFMDTGVLHDAPTTECPDHAGVFVSQGGACPEDGHR